MDSTSIRVSWALTNDSHVEMGYTIRCLGGVKDGDCAKIIELNADEHEKLMQGLTPCIYYTFEITSVYECTNETALSEASATTRRRCLHYNSLPDYTCQYFKLFL